MKLISTFVLLLAFAAPLGADYASLTRQEATMLGIPGGVIVTNIHPGGALSNQTKMRAGFIITKINDLPTYSVAALNEVLSRQKGHIRIQGIYRGSKQAVYYSVHDF